MRAEFGPGGPGSSGKIAIALHRAGFAERGESFQEFFDPIDALLGAPAETEAACNYSLILRGDFARQFNRPRYAARVPSKAEATGARAQKTMFGGESSGRESMGKAIEEEVRVEQERKAAERSSRIQRTDTPTAGSPDQGSETPKAAEGEAGPKA
jgi:hypothetical protein